MVECSEHKEEKCNLSSDYGVSEIHWVQEDETEADAEPFGCGRRASSEEQSTFSCLALHRQQQQLLAKPGSCSLDVIDVKKIVGEDWSFATFLWSHKQRTHTVFFVFVVTWPGLLRCGRVSQTSSPTKPPSRWLWRAGPLASSTASCSSSSSPTS